MRRAVLGLITLIALCLGGLAPAEAATKPPQVGLVSFSAATLHSLTITWAPVANATRYEIFMSRSYSGLSKSKKRIASTPRTVTAAWIGKLDSNTNYFLQVRAMNGSKAGSRSARVGHSTLRATGQAAGPVYNVLTYNVCSRVCSGWETRRPAVLERITTLQPEIVALQEAECGSSYQIGPPIGYAEVPCKSAKQLFYNDARFDLAKTTCPTAAKSATPALPTPTPSATPTPTPTPTPSPSPTPSPTPTSTSSETAAPVPTAPTPSTPTPTPTAPTPSATPSAQPPVSKAAPQVQAACTPEYRTGYIKLNVNGPHGADSRSDGDRYAVWAELIDHTANDKHVIFVSVHLVSGSSNTAATWRRDEIWQLLNGSSPGTSSASLTTSEPTSGLRAINPGDALPVVIAGDFNSYKGKSNDTVSADLNTAAYYTSFDQALNLVKQHQNSFGGFRVDPALGIKWGDHMDHVWVNPWITRTLYWQNVGRMSGPAYATPIGSDHNPILATIQVN